jgi:hypothetical protein
MLLYVTITMYIHDLQEKLFQRKKGFKEKYEFENGKTKFEK